MRTVNPKPSSEAVTAERRRYAVRTAIEKLKDVIPLERYAGELTELRHQGPNLVGLCPIHTEKTPSFTVYPDAHFYCFGCHAHGDVLDLCELVEHHADTWTAVVSLSIRFGVELPERPPRWFRWQDEKAKRRKMLVDVFTARYQRKLFRWFFQDELLEHDDPVERAKEAQEIWEGLYPLARHCANWRVNS